MITSLKDLNENSLNLEIRKIERRINLEHIDQALYFPKFLQIETSRVCNSRCPFCLVEQYDKTVPFMSERLFDKLCDEMTPYKDWIIWVCLQKGGEPLMDPNIVSRVRKLKDTGIRHVNMSSNASMLDETMAVGLLTAGLDEITFSVDSVEKQCYEKIRKGLKYDRVMENIKRFFKLREALNPRFIIRVRGVIYHEIYGDHNLESQIAAWNEFWKPYIMPQDRLCMKKPHNWGNQMHVDGVEPQVKELYHPCISHWSTMNVTTSGLVPMCIMDYDAKVSLGDLNRQSIKDVWNSDRMNEMRAVHREGRRNQYEFCRGCTAWDLELNIEKDLDEKMRQYGMRL